MNNPDPDKMLKVLLEIRELCNNSRGDTWALVIYNLIEEVLGEEDAN